MVGKAGCGQTPCEVGSSVSEDFKNQSSLHDFMTKGQTRLESLVLKSGSFNRRKNMCGTEICL